MILTLDEQEKIVGALRDFLKGKPNAVGNLRRLAREIIARIDKPNAAD